MQRCWSVKPYQKERVRVGGLTGSAIYSSATIQLSISSLEVTDELINAFVLVDKVDHLGKKKNLLE